MDKIIWTEQLSVGNDAIDKDHQKIINLINTLIDYHNSSILSPNISDILYEIISYANHHLDFEETLLDELGYPELSLHKEQHKKYRESTIKITIEVSNIDDDVPDELLEFLKNWWVSHILEEDMKYKPFLQNKLK
ncbi:MAG: hemerythrin family protein [gamma proteobacterium symbiont of Taylorina sp.]|nr:hemerythrin family protein [gamma proteobacterium symbiont of Taylorina sp.]